MRAAVLSIGTELTRGELLNSNAHWLAEQLTQLGLEVVEHSSVDDDVARIAQTVDRLAAQVQVVVSTGGLGPTTDDKTTVAVARAVERDLRRDKASLEKIRRRWRDAGREMPKSNEKQADFPAGSDVLPNPVGTAPGFALKIGDCRSYFLPGVPKEMKSMLRESVVPELVQWVERTTHQVHVRTFGMTESMVGELLQGLEEEAGVTLGYRASFPEIEVKVCGRAQSAAQAEAKVAAGVERVRERLGDAVYGEGDDTFPGAVGRALRTKGLRLALAESCTGGLAGTLITNVPGSSEYLLFDAVTYSNHSKSKVLGVSPEVLRAHGAVSSETAAEMAEGALRLTHADIAVSVTGIAGPGGGTEKKPIGTVWFGLARRGAPTVTRTRRLTGDRERIRTLAAYIALHLVKRAAEGRALE